MVERIVYQDCIKHQKKLCVGDWFFGFLGGFGWMNFAVLPPPICNTTFYFFVYIRDVGKSKPTAKKRQEGKRLSHANTSNSAAYTGKTQPRLHNQVSHARRTN
jgi:hypothetical protein